MLAARPTVQLCSGMGKSPSMPFSSPSGASPVGMVGGGDGARLIEAPVGCWVGVSVFSYCGGGGGVDTFTKMLWMFCIYLVTAGPMLKKKKGSSYHYTLPKTTPNAPIGGSFIGPAGTTTGGGTAGRVDMRRSTLAASPPPAPAPEDDSSPGAAPTPAAPACVGVCGDAWGGWWLGNGSCDDDVALTNIHHPHTRTTASMPPPQAAAAADDGPEGSVRRKRGRRRPTAASRGSTRAARMQRAAHPVRAAVKRAWFGLVGWCGCGWWGGRSWVRYGIYI